MATFCVNHLSIVPFNLLSDHDIKSVQTMNLVTIFQKNLHITPNNSFTFQTLSIPKSILIILRFFFFFFCLIAPWVFAGDELVLTGEILHVGKTVLSTFPSQKRSEYHKRWNKWQELSTYVDKTDKTHNFPLPAILFFRGGDCKLSFFSITLKKQCTFPVKMNTFLLTSLYPHLQYVQASFWVSSVSRPSYSPPRQN